MTIQLPYEDSLSLRFRWVPLTKPLLISRRLILQQARGQLLLDSVSVKQNNLYAMHLKIHSFFILLFLSNKKSKQVDSSHCLKALRFHILFQSPLGVLFTFPSRYYFAIGHPGVFSLARWSLLIHKGFHVPHATRVRA